MEKCNDFQPCAFRYGGTKRNAEREMESKREMYKERWRGREKCRRRETEIIQRYKHGEMQKNAKTNAAICSKLIASLNAKGAREK